MTILYLSDQYSQQRQREKKRWIYPVKLAMQAQHYRNLGHRVIWDSLDFDGVPERVITEPEDINFENLPAPDRVFTRSFDKKYQSNGNFKYHPATYIQVADGCWWGKCSFCVEKKNQWRVRPVWDVIQELKEIQKLGFKEVFDDSGTFPVGKWLEDFIGAIKKSEGGLRLRLGCNMRCVDVDYRAMRDVGFRMVLFGVESANQKTLDRINKGVSVGDFKYIKKASDAGLEPHVAIMVGYPWESEDDAKHTLRLVSELLKKGYAKTAQASVYDVGRGSGVVEKRTSKLTRRIYDAALSPEFWINKIKSIKTGDDLKYFFRQIREGLFHG